MLQKEYSLKESVGLAKNLFKNKSLKHGRDSLKPGDLFLGSYAALNDNVIYDKKPFVLLLRQNKTHILGLNFHYLPMKFRTFLIKTILKVNAKNIKNKKRLEFSYLDFKPLFKRLGYSPCIRLYIRKRISSAVIKIPSYMLMEAAKINTAVFSGVSSELLYKKAIQQSKQK